MRYTTRTVPVNRLRGTARHVQVTPRTVAKFTQTLEGLYRQHLFSSPYNTLTVDQPKQMYWLRMFLASYEAFPQHSSCSCRPCVV